MNVFSVLNDGTLRWPDRIAVVDQRQQMNYGELRHAAESMAGELHSAGIREGDKVGVLFPRGLAEIVAGFAAARLGAVAVQISATSKAAEIARLSESLILDAVVCDPRLTSLVPGNHQGPPANSGLTKSSASVRRFLRPKKDYAEREPLLARNAGAIGFSSGTTSESKAILLSHEALLARARMETECFGVDGGESVVYLLSITYAFAPPVLAALCRGATLLIGDAGAPEHLEKMVGEHGANLVYAAPLNYRMLLNEEVKTAECLRGARYLVSTGSRLPEALLDDYCSSVNHEIINRYGLNECGMVCANMSGSRLKRGSIGAAVGPEIGLAGESVTSMNGEADGEMLVRGPALFEGYCNPWRPREEFCLDGWFRTGDLARRDKDGHYWIIGRLKEMINVGGLKVVPAEIEDILTGHPEVEEAVVFGVADERFGEAPMAKVRVLAGSRLKPADILRYVRERVAFYKSPRSIEIVEQLPKTATGKIKRASIR